MLRGRAQIAPTVDYPLIASVIAMLIAIAIGDVDQKAADVGYADDADEKDAGDVE